MLLSSSICQDIGQLSLFSSEAWSFGFVFPGVDGLSIEITTLVDIRDQTNKELAMRLVTDIQNGDVFHTDLNGFQVRILFFA